MRLEEIIEKVIKRGGSGAGTEKESNDPVSRPPPANHESAEPEDLVSGSGEEPKDLGEVGSSGHPGNDDSRMDKPGLQGKIISMKYVTPKPAFFFLYWHTSRVNIYIQ